MRVKLRWMLLSAACYAGVAFATAIVPAGASEPPCDGAVQEDCVDRCDHECPSVTKAGCAAACPFDCPPHCCGCKSDKDGCDHGGCPTCTCSSPPCAETPTEAAPPPSDCRCGVCCGLWWDPTAYAECCQHKCPGSDCVDP